MYESIISSANKYHNKFYYFYITILQSNFLVKNKREKQTGKKFLENIVEFCMYVQTYESCIVSYHIKCIDMDGMEEWREGVWFIFIAARS